MGEEFALQYFIKSVRRGSPLLWWSSVAMIFGMVICMALSFIDVRLIAGVNIWGKPAKFFLSLVVQSFTLAWALSLVPEKLRGAKVASLIFVLAAWTEMAYIIFRASRGELSHFNTSSLTAAILYPLMGVGAVSRRNQHVRRLAHLAAARRKLDARSSKCGSDIWWTIGSDCRGLSFESHQPLDRWRPNRCNRTWLLSLVHDRGRFARGAFYRLAHCASLTSGGTVWSAVDYLWRGDFDGTGHACNFCYGGERNSTV
jgi:hypothetical protein